MWLHALVLLYQRSFSVMSTTEEYPALDWETNPKARGLNLLLKSRTISFVVVESMKPVSYKHTQKQQQQNKT